MCSRTRHLKVVQEDGKTEVGAGADLLVHCTFLPVSATCRENADSRKVQVNLPIKRLRNRPQVQTSATHLEESVLNSGRFERFTTFTSLVGGVAFLVHMARSYKRSSQDSKCKGWHKCTLPRTPDEMAQAGKVILKATQKTAMAVRTVSSPCQQTHTKEQSSEDTRPNLGGWLSDLSVLEVDYSTLILLPHRRTR